MLLVAGAGSLSGCGVDNSDNLDNVPPEGLFAAVEVNQHRDDDEVQVAAAVFRDGEPVDMVAGDIFKAVNGPDEALLRNRGNYKGSYAATLDSSDPSLGVSLSIVHEPVEARDRRWYPVDLINVDPGPGELVGPVASVFFPPAISITGPPTDSTYTRLDENVDLSWVALGQGDPVTLRTAIRCDQGLATSTYGTEHELGDDDGLEVLQVGDVIVDLTSEAPFLAFIDAAARALLQELLNQLSAGRIDPDYFARDATANPSESACEIRLFLYRSRAGIADPVFDSGTVVGSRSDERVIRYIPPVVALP